MRERDAKALELAKKMVAYFDTDVEKTSEQAVEFIHKAYMEVMEWQAEQCVSAYRGSRWSERPEVVSAIRYAGK